MSSAILKGARRAASLFGPGPMNEVCWILLVSAYCTGLC